ncbi:MAG: response regulator [Deltaproteobacteria bacterium]|nr:response regulator [Deltaproteobacteria bacterium]
MDDGRRVREILVVEDNPLDVQVIREALASAVPSTVVHAVGDGDDAVRFLCAEGRFTSSRRPDLVLLDLRLPGRSGRDVLRWIRGDEAVRCIPVVVLSSSNSPAEIEDVYCLGANCYVVKPPDLAALTAAVEAIARLWLVTAALPEARFGKPADPADRG